MKSNHIKNSVIGDNAPKYEQAKRLLIHYIESLPPEVEYLPFEYELVKTFGVTRVSLRRALAELRKEGMIQTLRSRGSKILRRDFAERELRQEPVSVLPPGAVVFAADTEEGRPTNYYIWRVMNQLERKVQQAGSSVAFIDARLGQDEFQDTATILHRLQEAGCRWGLVFYNDKLDMEELLRQMLIHRIKPILCLDSLKMMMQCGEILLPGIDFIAENQGQVIKQALEEHFTGCDYIAMIAGRFAEEWVEDRVRIVRAFAMRHGIEFDFLQDADPRRGDNPIREVYTKVATGIVNDLLPSIVSKIQRAKRPLLFAANDNFALGIVAWCDTAGIRCPEDLEILGYDNLDETKSKNLSTFEKGSEEIASAAFELLQLLKDAPDGGLHISNGRLTSSRFIGRATTLNAGKRLRQM